MTEYVDGKKYRVTRDYGVMKYCGGDYFINADSGLIVDVKDSSVSAEPIPDPLPTAQGSVVRTSDPKDVLLLGSDSKWIDVDGATFGPGAIGRDSWTLIYDAGAQS